MAGPRRKRRRDEAAADDRRVVEAALELAALQGWRDTSLEDIAGRADLTLAALRRRFPTRGHILAAFLAEIDRTVLEGGEAAEDEPVRDRLFDVLMRRFDALAPHRKAVEAISRDLLRRPGGLARFAAGPFRRSMAAMLEAAAVPSWGPLQALQVKGLEVVYLAAFRTFLEDDSEDRGRTMAALDRALKRAEDVLDLLPCRNRRRAEGESATAA